MEKIETFRFRSYSCAAPMRLFNNVSLLMDGKADIDLQNNDGKTAVMLAVKIGVLCLLLASF